MYKGIVMKTSKSIVSLLLLLVIVTVVIGCKRKNEQNALDKVDTKVVIANGTVDNGTVDNGTVDKDIAYQGIDNSSLQKDRESAKKYNISLLEYSVQKGNLNGVKVAILEGTDLEEVDHAIGNTALMNASLFGHLDIVKHLVEQGAMIDSNSNDLGLTALMWASQNGNIDIANYLIKQGADISNMTIVEWAGLGFLQDVEDSIKLGNDINIGSPFYGVTALMTASDNGHIEVVKFLIENGADINAKMDYVETALMYASTAGHLEVVKYLIKNGADMNVRTDFFESALIKAIMYGHLDVVKHLVESGVNINHDKDKWGGQSILSIATNSENTEIIEYLKSKGAK